MLAEVYYAGPCSRSPGQTQSHLCLGLAVRTLFISVVYMTIEGDGNATAVRYAKDVFVRLFLHYNQINGTTAIFIQLTTTSFHWNCETYNKLMQNCHIIWQSAQ